jgi:hypothetical protein
MADVAEGRLTEFDARSVIALGRKLSADRAASGPKSDGKDDSQIRQLLRNQGR